MATQTPVARVSAVEGQVFAKNANGVRRALKVGDPVFEGDVIAAGPNSRVDMATVDNRIITLRANEALTVDAEVAAEMKPDAQDASIANAGKDVNKVIKAIREGGSLDELLEETAAGDGGSSADGGASFIRLLRIVEGVDPLSYEYGTERRGAVDDQISGGVDESISQDTVDAPLVARDSAVTGAEDTPLVLTWANFNLTDADSPVTGLSIRVISLPADGNLQYDVGTTALHNWIPVTANQLIAQADIVAGKLRFVPDLHESGTDGFTTPGTGNLRADYASFTYQGLDGTTNNAVATVMLDVAPVADAPSLSTTTSSLGLSENFESYRPSSGTWHNVALRPSSVWKTDNPGNGVEIGTAATYGVGGPNTYVIELEANTGNPSNFYTDVSTVAGAVYRLSFDYSPRGGREGDSRIDISWGGVKSGTIHAPQAGFRHYDMEFVGNGSVQRLEFKATTSDSLGGVLDNISLNHALNEGWQGASVNLGAIATSLVDNDGSESLAVQIGGIATGSVISDGSGKTATVDFSGVAVVTGWDYGHLVLTPPDSFSGSMTLDVRAISSESTGGSVTTSAASLVVNVHPSLNITLTASDIAFGTPGDDTITGSSANDVLNGGLGDDVLIGGAGADVVHGGSGNDQMTGGLGADIFRWQLAEGGRPGTPFVDTVADFSTALPNAGGDVLDLRDLLLGDSNAGGGVGNLANYLHFEKSGGDTIVQISSAGGFTSGFNSGAVDQSIVLQGVDLSAGGLTSDQMIIQDLLGKGKLLTD